MGKLFLFLLGSVVFDASAHAFVEPCDFPPKLQRILGLSSATCNWHVPGSTWYFGHGSFFVGPGGNVSSMSELNSYLAILSGYEFHELQIVKNGPKKADMMFAPIPASLKSKTLEISGFLDSEVGPQILSSEDHPNLERVTLSVTDGPNAVSRLQNMFLYASKLSVLEDYFWPEAATPQSLKNSGVTDLTVGTNWKQNPTSVLSGLSGLTGLSRLTFVGETSTPIGLSLDQLKKLTGGLLFFSTAEGLPVDLNWDTDNHSERAVFSSLKTLSIGKDVSSGWPLGWSKTFPALEELSVKTAAHWIHSPVESPSQVESKLTHLEISNAPGLREIRVDPSFSQISQFTFLNTGVVSLPEQICALLPHLNSLDLSQNQLSVLPSAFLRGCFKLGALYLNGTRIVDLPVNFSNQTSEQGLFMALDAFEDGTLRSADPREFTHIVAVPRRRKAIDATNSYVDLSGLKYLWHSDEWKPGPSLLLMELFIGLKGLSLTSIPDWFEGAFSGARSTLDLSNNQIRFLQAGDLKKIGNFIAVDLSGNPIETILTGAISGATPAWIYFSNTSIAQIKDAAMGNAPNLKRLWLRLASSLRLEPSMFVSQPTPTILVVEGGNALSSATVRALGKMNWMVMVP